ncbi:MAG: hypothetical protein N2A99_06300 [Carnobacterium alterfunditum]
MKKASLQASSILKFMYLYLLTHPDLILEISMCHFFMRSASSIAQTVGQETAIEVLYDLESVAQEMQDDGIDYLTLMRKNLKAL